MENHIKWIHQQKVKKFAVITEYWENLFQCQYSAQTRNDTTAWQATGKGCKWEVGEVQQSEITLMWLQACSPLTCHQWDQNLFPSLLGHSGLQPAVNCCHRLDSGWAAAGEHTTWVCHQLGLGQTCLHKKTSRALSNSFTGVKGFTHNDTTLYWVLHKGTAITLRSLPDFSIIKQEVKLIGGATRQQQS